MNDKNGCSVCNLPYSMFDARDDNSLRDLVALSVDLDKVLQEINKEMELQKSRNHGKEEGLQEVEEGGI